MISNGFGIVAGHSRIAEMIDDNMPWRFDADDSLFEEFLLRRHFRTMPLYCDADCSPISLFY